MASTLTVDNIVGATTAANVHIPNHVVQVKQFVLTTVDSISTTTFSDSPLTVNITPSSTTSLIRVTINGYFGIHFWNAHPYWRLRRGSTSISHNEGNMFPNVQQDSDKDQRSCLPLIMDILDSPSTTSQVTYTLQGRTGNSSYHLRLNRRADQNVSLAQTTITAMEIAQ